MTDQRFPIDDLTGHWDYSLLPKNVVLGRDCYIERKESFSRFGSVQNPGLMLGDRVTVYTWTAFSIDSKGQVVVGNDCVLVGALFMCAERIILGDNVMISYNVTLADSDFHPVDPDERRRDAVAIAPFGDSSKRPRILTSPVNICDDVWIGIGAIVLKGVTIGKGARVGAAAVVTNDVPENAYVVGNPARVKR